MQCFQQKLKLSTYCITNKIIKEITITAIYKYK